MKRCRYIIAAVLCCFLAIGINADTIYSTENDPLVTLSYVDKIKGEILEELKNELDIKDLIESMELPETNYGYEILELKSGDVFWAKASCEIILRSGKADIIVTDENNIINRIGLSDLTDGKELLNNEALPINHYVIISRGDGRGVKITSDKAYLMVRGEYEVGTE